MGSSERCTWVAQADDGRWVTVNGVLVDPLWSGTWGWTPSAVVILAGTHTVEWRYTKDGGVSSGSDRVWIDDVQTGEVEGSGALCGGEADRGAMTALSRRDVAAMRLALECLRRPMSARSLSWLEPLRFGGEVARDIRRACDRTLAQGRALYATTRYERRLLRARLALVLRVLLRADAGDYGKRWWHCSADCGAGDLTRWPPPEGASCIHCDEGVYVHAECEPIRPLWESAPAHGTTPSRDSTGVGGDRV